MTAYRVELRGDAREVYTVEADSPEEAEEFWHTGTLDLTECSGMEVQRVEVDE